LNALRHHLMDPALFKEFCDELTREMNRLRMEGRASIDAAQSELRRVEKQMKATVDAIADGMYHPSMKEKMNGLEVRKGELEAFLSDAAEPPPLLHPNMAMHYRIRIEELYVALQEDSEAKRMVAADIIRSLVKEIILTPEEGELQIDVRGDLAGILSVSLKTRTPATRAGDRNLSWLRGPAQIRTCGRKKAARLGRLMCAIWHRNSRWLRGRATISNCSFHQRGTTC
jgi:hypothetical protein